MRYKQFKLGAALLIGVGLTALQAQEGLVATGGNATGSGSASYSIGQITYHSFVSTSGSSLEGVQQAFEIFAVGTDEIKGSNLMISVYPNPSTGYLTLSIADIDRSDLSYRLYNMQGKHLLGEKIKEPRTRIAMNELVPSTYFVKVLQNNEEVKTFKIIKK